MSEKTRPLFAMTVMRFSLIIIPICSIWWVIFINRDYIEGQGNELLFVCKNKIKTMDTFIAFILFFFVSIIQFAFYIQADSSLKYEPVKLFCVCLFFYCFVQFLTYLTKSIPITLLMVLVYTIANPMIAYSIDGAVFPIFYDVTPLTMESAKASFMPMVLAGVVLLLISVYFNKRKLRFN
ncbi:MAG: hypothetical protein K2J41_05205 [Eubacterium sp.]|nr:hypothetical protein [Eubacterium sp.]